MSDFVPEDLSTFVVDKEDQVLYTEIYESTLVRGAFFVNEPEAYKKKVTVLIYGPYGEIIQSHINKEEGIIRFNTKDFGPGTYKFIFEASNGKIRSGKKAVTFALHTGEIDPDDQYGHHILMQDPEWREFFTKTSFKKCVTRRMTHSHTKN